MTTTMETTTTTTTISLADQLFLQGAKGFIERYVRNCAYYHSCRAAYEQTERQYAALTGTNRYKTYESFRAAYSNFYARQRR